MPPDNRNGNIPSAAENSLGRPNFVALTGLDSPERQEMLARILAKIDEEKLEVIRVACVDTHGIVRVRPIEARLFSQVVRNGVAFPAALFSMDSANNIFQNVFAHGDTVNGAYADMFAMPDLATFRVLPWAHKCGWILSDLYKSSGGRCPYDPRLIMQTACNRLAQQGLTYIGGVEIECHIVKVTDPRTGFPDCTQPSMPAFSNPTLTGYKRLNANPLAPNRVVWSCDNKGAMCRLVGGMGDPATHIENRSGDPAANPYLYMGTQIVAGLDGVANRIDPGSPLANPYEQTQRPRMPNSLNEAVDALAASTMFREALGNEFIDHYVTVRRHEIGRFQSYVTDWEHREYFETF